MSSKSSNASSSSTTTMDNDVGADGNAIVAQADGGDVIVNATSQEAVDLGLAFAETALQLGDVSIGTGRDIAMESIEQGKDVLVQALTQSNAVALSGARQSQGALDTVNRVLDTALTDAKDDSTEISQQLIRLGIPAAVIIFALTRFA